jgi:hypothetical protein
MENKKLSIGPIIAFVLSSGMIGSVAMGGFVPMLPQAFAEPNAQSNVAYNGPQVPQVSIQPQNGIPLGPPYGNPTAWHEEQTIALAVSFGALAVVVTSLIYFISGKSLPIMRIR